MGSFKTYSQLTHWSHQDQSDGYIENLPTIYPLGKVWVNCLKTLNKLSMCLPGKTPSAPSVIWAKKRLAHGCQRTSGAGFLWTCAQEESGLQLCTWSYFSARVCPLRRGPMGHGTTKKIGDATESMGHGTSHKVLMVQYRPQAWQWHYPSTLVGIVPRWSLAARLVFHQGTLQSLPEARCPLLKVPMRSRSPKCQDLAGEITEKSLTLKVTRCCLMCLNQQNVCWAFGPTVWDTMGQFLLTHSNLSTPPFFQHTHNLSPPLNISERLFYLFDWKR